LTPVIRGTTEAAAVAASNFKNVRRRDVIGPSYKFGASAALETAASTGTIDSELAPAEGMVAAFCLHYNSGQFPRQLSLKNTSTFCLCQLADFLRLRTVQTLWNAVRVVSFT
jgi:hypothetical protein